METLVRDGRYYTIGDTGAEFIKYQRGDIIFNHRQTEELFTNGKVTSGGGRAKALASGTAFSKGSGGLGKVAVLYEGDGRKEVESKTKAKLDKSKVKVTTTTTVDPSDGGSSGSGGGTGSSGGNSVGTSKDTEEFKETFDWIEVAIDRIERSISRLDQKAGNIYKSWSSRNEALTSEIGEVRKEIDLQEAAYNRYMKAANSVGLSESYAKKVRDGTIDISTITNEGLAEKIKEYQKWYEKALDCKDAIDELKEAEAALYKQRFDNVAAEYEGILSIIGHEKNMLDEFISQSEAQGWFVSEKYYEALIDNEEKKIEKLEEEKTALLNELEAGMQSGAIEKNSQAWYEMVNAVDEVTLAIEESNTAILEFQQTIQQFEWEVFDLIQDKISSITEEADFLIELMSNSKLYEDNGQLTDEGMATMGLHAVNYNTYMRQADEAGKEAERLKKELEEDPFDLELEQRYRDTVALQQDYILAAEEEKEAIRDLVKDGIELELDALQERIDKYNESINAAKDLYEYQKRVKEQTKEIASLEKQIAAYTGDDSEEAKSKVQELKVSLEEAKSDLEETEYDRYISDQQKLLDDLYLEYETILNTRLDNVEALISDTISAINTNSDSISNTIREVAEAAGYELSDSMETILPEEPEEDIVTNYGENFSSAQTTTNAAINAINKNVSDIITGVNNKAEANINIAGSSSAANSPQANATPTPTAPAAPTTPTAPTAPAAPEKAAPSQEDVTGVALAIINGNHDWGVGEERVRKLEEAGFDATEVQNTVNELWGDKSVHNGTWSKKYGISNLSQYSYKNYESGVSKIAKDQLAWTQENGNKEMIVRPSDGAILTPLARNDSVLNATASNNIWSMANNPSEFIKDNLDLGTANVPNNSNTQNTYTQYLDKVVFNLPNVKNYDELLSEMQRDPNFEKLILSMSIDRLAGGSALAKGKAVR